MDGFLDIAYDVLVDSLADTLYLIPFLFITYLAMEWLEHRTGARTQDAIRRAGKAGPVAGAVLGVVPQCGFSAVAATLWAGRVITLGTLFAVFLSTSDEMLPIFIAEQVPAGTILSIMGAKVAIGMAMGFAIDVIVRLVRRNRNNGEDNAEDEPLRIHELCEHDKCHCTHDCETCEENPASVYEHFDDCGHDCSHEYHVHDHSHDGAWKGIFESALIHTVQVTVFIFMITMILNAVLIAVGEDALGGFLAANPGFSVFASALVGLIPNCAASVVVAQLYVDGILGAGAMLAGLLVSAGVGLLVLCRTNRHLWQNLAVIAGLYAIGVIWGSIVNASGVVF